MRVSAATAAAAEAAELLEAMELVYRTCTYKHMHQ